jgi:hypothetical protein
MESWLGDRISPDFTGSLQAAIDIVQTIGEQASIFADGFLERFGGRLYGDSEADQLGLR